MVVGDDDAVGVDDHARAEALAGPVALTVEVLEQRVGEAAAADGRGGADVDDGRCRGGGDGGKAVAHLAQGGRCFRRDDRRFGARRGRRGAAALPIVAGQQAQQEHDDQARDQVARVEPLHRNLPR